MSKSFREVIANIKEGEKWIGRNFIIMCKENCIDIEANNGIMNCKGIFFVENDMFERERITYQFSRAKDAYKEGKTIESCVSGVKFNKKEKSFGFFMPEIEGRWYINE